MEQSVSVEVTNISKTSYDEPNICPSITCFQVSWSVHVFKAGSDVRLCLFCLPNNQPPMLLRADWEIKLKPVSSEGPKKCWRCRIKLTHHNMKNRCCCAAFICENVLSKASKYYQNDSLLLEIKIIDPEREGDKWKCKGEISPNRPGEDMKAWYKQMFRVTDEWQEDIRGRKSLTGTHPGGRTNRVVTTGTGFVSYLDKDDRPPFASESSPMPGRGRSEDHTPYRKAPMVRMEDRHLSVPTEHGIGPVITELTQRPQSTPDFHTPTRDERSPREPQRRSRSVARERDDRREAERRSASRHREDRRENYVPLPPSGSHEAVSQIVTKETSEEAIIRLSNLEESVEILKENIISMKRDMDVVKRKSSTTMHYDMSAFSKVESEGRSLEGAVSRSEEKLKTSSENIERTRRDSQTLMENFNKLSSSVNRIDKHERKLGGDVAVLSQQVEHMSIKAINLDSRVEEMESDMKEMKEQMNATKDEMRNIGASIGEITEFAKRLEVSTQQTKVTINTMEQALVVLVEAVDKITVNVKKLKKYEKQAKKKEATDVYVKERMITQI